MDSASTFTALGEMRQRLNRSPRTDIDQINLLENIGWTVRQIFFSEPLHNGTGSLETNRNRIGQDAAVGGVSVDLR